MIVMPGVSGCREAAICRKPGRSSRTKLDGWDAATVAEGTNGALK
jgi:hypothetical protein